MNMAYDWGSQVEIQRIAAEAWLEYEAGDRDRALQLMQQAAEKEASTDKNPRGHRARCSPQVSSLPT